MRITANTTSDNALYNLQQQRAKLGKLSEQLASQKNINRPSDDPINSRLLLDVGDKIKATDQYTSNITKSGTFLQVTSTALQGMADTMLQANQLVATITSGSNDVTERQSVATQLKALKQTMVDMGNVQSGDQYVFGGAKSSTAPFSATSPYYSGDETALNVEIGQSTTQQMNIPGNQVLTGSSAILPANSANTPYGTTNILDSFDKMITAVMNNDLTSAASIQAEAKNLENGAKQITNAQSDVASRVIRLDNMTKLNTNSVTMLSNVFSNIQDADIATLGVKLTQQQTAFDASLSTTAKIGKMSLLDYM